MRFKILFILILCTIFPCSLFSQAGTYFNGHQSHDAWRFGIQAGVAYDWINIPRYADAKIGYKVGICGEKHLVYNIYFKPVFNFFRKSCDILVENNFKDEIRGYLVDVEATIELKFGDERKGRGLICYMAPYFSYGVGGKSFATDLKTEIPDGKDVVTEYRTFADNNVNKEDLGFVLGVGYDISQHFQIDFNYVIGYFSYNSYNNFRWKSLQIGLIYFL